MQLPLFQVDAFASQPFAGNPAAVCPLDDWLPDHVLQAIAEENNLSETAFFVACEGGFHIRWFTPVAEVDLCGHATLAAAFVIFTEFDTAHNELVFQSRSGPLKVTRDGHRLVLDFPAQPPTLCAVPDAITRAFAAEPVACLAGEDYLVVFDSEDAIRAAAPDMAALASLDRRGVIITALRNDNAFVSRFFVPKLGISEDPVTGSAHTQLTPYWAAQTGNTDFIAHQLSRRGGELHCSIKGDRVLIAGQAVKYLTGTITIPH
ncbi:PhzF family phenazine biosynthesis protein [Alteromonas sp. CYL-A6]|uniref:PhzF family phenazine biosynthesis protein n=1 Tax=Alteromonas nitratireducens TaxID=3390813 RepID=UPI0034B6BBCD